MKKRNRVVGQDNFHVEGWHPFAAAVLGAFAFLVVAVLVLLVLLCFSDSPLEPSWALPVLVTAIGAGGAAGIAIKNVNLKRAESRRSKNLMFDSQLETGASLLGEETESAVIAGSLLLASLLRESERHAQACADLLCTALRRKRSGDVAHDAIPDMIAEMEEHERAEFLETMGTGDRIRNALTRAIAQALASEGAPPHLTRVKWDFQGAIFGSEAAMRDCVFGAGTAFRYTTAPGSMELDHSTFVGGVLFEGMELRGRLNLRTVKSDGWIDVRDTRLLPDSSNPLSGIHLEKASVQGLNLDGVTSDGLLNLDDAQMAGDVSLSDLDFRYLSMFDSQAAGAINMWRLSVEQSISLRNVRTRKRISLVSCKAGEQIEVSRITPEGKVRLEDCRAASYIPEELQDTGNGNSISPER